MLILILSLKLSIVPYEAGPECRGQHLPIYRCQTASQVSLSVGFLISRISLPRKLVPHEKKSFHSIMPPMQ